jgi:hypothetical protein
MALYSCTHCGEVDTSKGPLCKHLAPQFDIGKTPEIREELDALHEIVKLMKDLKAEMRGLREALVES